MKHYATNPVAGALLATLALALGAGCAPEEAVETERQARTSPEAIPVVEGYADLIDGDHADHRPAHQVVLYDVASVQEQLGDDGILRLDYPEPFLQVGMQFDAAEGTELHFRALSRAGEWTDWDLVDVPWWEGKMHNGLILLEEPAVAVELAGGETMEFLRADFFAEIIARNDLIRNDGTWEPEANYYDEDIRTVQQGVAPGSLVVSRANWGAINPGKICGSVVAPYRMAIHHTAVPSSDGGDAAARMRGMQNYHMNTLGWCDIGYHFVVAQSGVIYQARSRSNRPGAHVGNQNHGNVGISMIGNYTTAAPTQAQLTGMGKIVRWVHDTHGVGLNRTRILGHREHAGQTTSCPGNNGLAHINEIISRAQSGGAPAPPPPPPPPPPAEYDVDVDVLIHGLDNFYTQGTSANVPDALAGDTFTAEIRVKNRSTDPIRGVQVRYAFDEGLRATNYRIETDHPAYNQSSWQLNDANDAPSNPDHGAMGQSGTLTMHAFSPNETKRIVVDLRADQYNLGIFDFAGVRAWVHNIDDVYAQANYGSTPTTNEVGYRLRDASRVDVMSRDEWQFRTGERDDVEGWTADGSTETLAVNTNLDLLAHKVEGPGAGVISPSWTQIDADKYDEMVVTLRSHDGPRDLALYWARDGEEFVEGRSVRFKAHGDGEFYTMLVPVGRHPAWSGEVAALRLEMNRGLEVGEEDSGWYDLDVLYFQNVDAGETSSDTLGVVDGEPTWAEFPGLGERDLLNQRRPRGLLGTALDQDDEAAVSRVNVNRGCSSTGGGGVPAGWLLLVVGGLVVLRRR